MGGLLGDVVAFRVIRKFPIASESLAKDRIEGFFDSSRNTLDFRFSVEVMTIFTVA